MSARILAFRPDRLVVEHMPSSDPEAVYMYLRGLAAGDRHGYARGRKEGVRDLWRAVSGYFTTPLRGRR